MSTNARLAHLDIHHLRNIANASLTSLGSLNIISGPNGSGKTSLLEAISLLSRGQSFRTSNINTLVQHHTQTMRVVGKLHDNDQRMIPIGLERSAHKTLIKVEGAKLQKVSDLVRIFPVQVISPESNVIIESGPKFRRQIMDWGVFHVEHNYIEIWKNYLRALKQRNMLLHQHAGPSLLRPWDRQLVDTGLILHQARQAYVNLLEIQFADVCEKLIDFGQIQLEYKPGWGKKSSYPEALEASLKDDLAYGHTRVGPHRSDLRITVNNRPVEQVASRGQKKLIIYALKLAQLATISGSNGVGCSLLVDDIAAELDWENRSRLLAYIGTQPYQVFITTTELKLLPDFSSVSRLFHVKHGNIHQEP